MEKLERSKFTRAGEVANERLIEAVTDPDRYPEGTTFIAADQEGFGAILAEAVASIGQSQFSSPTVTRSSPPERPPPLPYGAGRTRTFDRRIMSRAGTRLSSRIWPDRANYVQGVRLSSVESGTNFGTKSSAAKITTSHAVIFTREEQLDGYESGGSSSVQ